MKHQNLFGLRTVAVFCLSWLLCSCDGRAQTIMQRRDTAIQNLNEYYVRRDAGPLWSRTANKSLVALTNATAKSLEKPLLTSAILVQRTNQSVRLSVHWIASAPAADEVELDVGDGLNPLTIPIEANNIKDNESQAKRSVIFYAGFGWKSGDNVARRLNAVTSPIHLKVRLRRSNTTVTQWFPVELNKDGKWVTP
jgi:hypothetical protein